MSKQILSQDLKTAKIQQEADVGVMHVEIASIPLTPDDTSRLYLFVAMEDSTRWVYTHTYRDVTTSNIGDFLRRFRLASPIKIGTIVTYSSDFKSFFNGADNESAGNRAFMLIGAGVNIELRGPSAMKNISELFIHGMISRLKHRRLTHTVELAPFLRKYVTDYNRKIPQRNIDSKTKIRPLRDGND